MTNEDFKAPLNFDDPDNLGSTVILESGFKVISHFWKEESVPPELKKVILRPFLKDSTEDEHDPNNSTTISLINTC